jgi:mannose-6-phosphate isomerase-like protein (cupin superfamily)
LLDLSIFQRDSIPDTKAYAGSNIYYDFTGSEDSMPNYEVKNLSASKEVRTFGQSKIELVDLAGNTIGRFTLQKGWKWSNDIKPVVKTEWCEATHVQYIISGKYHVKMKDGSEFDLGPGDAGYVAPGHDAWVTSNEPLVGIEFVGARVATEGPNRN